MKTQITHLDLLFDAFYSTHIDQDLEKAQECKKHIFDALTSKGKRVYEIYNGKASLEVLSFNSFIANFSSFPNPFSSHLENIRFGNRSLFDTV
jgi:hypothetical protein